jgi:hypothetical protein
MVGFTDKRAAMFLHELVRMSLLRRNVKTYLGGKDVVFPIDSESTILMDAGVRGQSRILAEGLDIIDSAQESVTYASEQFPTGAVARHLLDAHNKGVDVIIASNHPSKHDRYTWAHRVVKAYKKGQLPITVDQNCTHQ